MAEVSKLYFSSTGVHGSRGELVAVLAIVLATTAAILGACVAVWAVL